MNEHEARQIIQRYGMKLWRNRETHEWCITTVYHDDKERTERETYFTNDLDDAIATALDTAQRRDSVFQCHECGQWTCGETSEPTRTRLWQNHRCFYCDHWTLRLQSPPKNGAIVHGMAYTVHDKESRVGSHLGHGGALFKVRWLATGEVKESNNVWCQGRIPDHFRDRLPDTAEFLDPYEKPKCMCGVRTPPPEMVARHADDCPARDEEKP